MKTYKSRSCCRLLPVLLAVFLAAGCGSFSNPVQPGAAEAAQTEVAETEHEASDIEALDPKGSDIEPSDTESSDIKPSDIDLLEITVLELPAPGLPEEFDLSMVPEYKGSIWADVNEDVPFFTEKQMETARRMTSVLSSKKVQGDTDNAAEEELLLQSYGDLDTLGRCTGACALVGPETLPQEERGNIGMVKPTGWHTVKYDGIDGNYLYNRCHLIGFQLTGQGANDKNLITGTRSMNVEGMLPYEGSVLAYVKGTGNHVLYRVTPVFKEENLLAEGVLMEARSVEDPLVQFCAFCYNVQPGITIDYATGESSGPGFTGNKLSDRTGDRDSGKSGPPAQTGDQSAGADSAARDDSKGEGTLRAADSGAGDTEGQSDIREWKYIINVNSQKFHLPGCQSVEKMSRKNMQGFNGSREELIEMGYEPFKNCNP